jgi:hypothetical protein
MAATNGFGLTGLQLSYTSTSDRNSGPFAEPDAETTALQRRHEQFQHLDVQRNGFVEVCKEPMSGCECTDTIQELLMKIEMLQQKLKTAASQQQRDVDFVQAWQVQKLQYEKYFKQLHRSLVTTALYILAAQITANNRRTRIGLRWSSSTATA